MDKSWVPLHGMSPKGLMLFLNIYTKEIVARDKYGVIQPVENITAVQVDGGRVIASREIYSRD